MNEELTFKSVVSKILRNIKYFFKCTFGYPFYLIVHPLGGWDDFKREHLAKRWVSIFYVLMAILAMILNQTVRGFIVGGNGGKDFNLLRTILTVVLPIGVGVIASWCVGSLLDGKGKVGEIFDAIGYSLFPIVWFSILATFLSNFIVNDEIMIYNFLSSAGIALTIWMLFFGIMGVHQNSMGMNIINIIFTIVAVAIIIFVVLLFFSFIERILGWIISIYNEIKMRYF